MSITTTGVGKYGTIERLPQPNGADAQAQLGRMVARLVARYRLVAVPGRPEELVSPGTLRGVSVGYGCRTIRVRTMVDRSWIDYVDYQIQEGWQSRLYQQLDSYFSHTPSTALPEVISIATVDMARSVRDIPPAGL